MLITMQRAQRTKSPSRSYKLAAAILCTGLISACGGGSSSGGSPTYAVEVSITGLTATGLSLSLNGSAAAVPANSTSFEFPSKLQNASNYSVTVGHQPTGEVCTASNSSGTINGASIQVGLVCGALNTIGGSITGLLGSGLVLANAKETIAVSASSTSFVLPTAVAKGTAYSVVTQAQPAAQSCRISNGNGTMGSAKVTNVDVACAVWRWWGGSDIPTAGNYAALGVASPSNVPGARGGAASWVDETGVLWFFGGDGYDAFGMNGYLNDLWSFNPTTHLWTWIGGSTQNGAAGVYGTKGTPAAGNSPGARRFASAWRTPSGDAWLFAGYGHDATGTPGELNDLWKFSASTGLWTWITGSQSVGAAGVYGSKGVAAVANSPGSRDSAATWVDSSGNLWLFGGEGITSPGITGDLNDLWKFDTSTLKWTWVSGSATGNQDGIYGTLGTATAGSAPGSRYGASAWLDQRGRFWLFGGNGFDSSAAANLLVPNVLNDTWTFDPSSGLWTWVAGSMTSQAIGSYVAGGQSGGTVGARQYAATWIDPLGVAWIFGGIGRDSAGAQGGLNDLWKFESPTTGWIWVSGSKTVGAADDYGTKGVRALTNAPGARYAVVAWSDDAGNLWQYGGFGVITIPSFYSDIWQFGYP